MGAAKHIQETFQKEIAGEKDKSYDYKRIQHERLIEFRKEKSAVVRLEKPTNIPRARKLGYKAKKGFVVARVRVRKGSGLHRRPKMARKPKRMGINKLTRRLNIQAMSEQKAARKYKNCEVLNSYKIGDDGTKHYFEVILVDVNAPEIKSDRELNWICSKKHRGRAFRGLTSRGRKSRGLRRKGIGAEKVRPSLRAKNREAK
ncbi:MAG: 50S ribosomal protein L15e [Candidatus Diapherotrites archaeon]|uniref:50S ribosomal protein L15e n=1 Tax=Candidatus Iainarchaeum sp. TaxID=3101447 RepID=A0A939C7J1_9ARCH|nr:50S ribosomal protein L15e [Candidatus Diapherotrites archaeon]